MKKTFTSNCYSIKNEISAYGEKKNNEIFDKMKFCDYICSLDKETLKIVFSNLKDVVDNLIKIFNEK